MRKTLHQFVPVLYVFAGLACVSAPTERFSAGDVHETVLDNGLKVIVKIDTRAPIVVSQVWYKVGGSYEATGKTGISHVLEHMMFKGTDQLEANEFSKVIAANGGQENAFTGRDYTAYFQKLEKSRLAISFRLEADRMRNLRMTEEEFRKEVEVVKEERRLRTEDRPEALVYEQFMATAFRSSNYRNPVIGWPEDLDNLELSDLEAWYDSFYAPNNATVVVVGDVEPDAVFELATRYFGPIPRRDVTPVAASPEPKQQGPRRVSVQKPAKVPYLLMGFHVPSLGAENAAWEPYALEVLAYVLDGGKSARLPTSLVRRQRVASSVGVSYDAVSRLPTLFIISANPANGKTTEEVKTALLDEIERLQSEKVREKELEKVKAQIVAGNVFERDSSFYQAMKIGELETVGLDWRLENELVERLKSVTAEQVQAVARKYLDPDAMTIGVLEPTSLTGWSG